MTICAVCFSGLHCATLWEFHSRPPYFELIRPKYGKNWSCILSGKVRKMHIFYILSYTFEKAQSHTVAKQGHNSFCFCIWQELTLYLEKMFYLIR